MENHCVLKAMSSLVEQVLLLEQELSASDWRIPIAILVICSIITYWKKIEWWLILWIGYTAEKATVEEAWAIESQFLNTSLEDKTFLMAGVMIGN